MTRIDKETAPWLGDEALQRLLAVLSEGGEEARVAGGAVRNTLLGELVTDIDIATTTLPHETVRRAEAAGFKTVPTGIEHGTITVVAGGKPFEVTTLRADAETDGRHAVVQFGHDWQTDADRRDLTINALYCDAEGHVLDLVGGLPDIQSRTVRFIGEPEARIREDYLRILRFFRFFAIYGRGRPDAEGLKACARLKDGLDKLSAERVWSELRKLLGALDPSRALLWMRQAGVLTRVLPESEKWGIDAVHGLVSTEHALGWTPDPMLRLASIIPPDPTRAEGLARRLRFSKAETARLRDWAMADAPPPQSTDAALRAALYRNGSSGLTDRLRLALAQARGRVAESLEETAAYARMLALAETWQKPQLPVGGKDLAAKGFAQGPELGRELSRLEERWIASDFRLSRDELLV